MIQVPRRTKSDLSMRRQSVHDPFVGDDFDRNNAIRAAEHAFMQSRSRFKQEGVPLSRLKSSNSITGNRVQSSTYNVTTGRIEAPTIPHSRWSLSKTPGTAYDTLGHEIDSGLIDTHEREYVHRRPYMSGRTASQRLGKARSILFWGRPSIQASRSYPPNAGRHLRRRSMRSSESLGPPRGHAAYRSVSTRRVSSHGPQAAQEVPSGSDKAVRLTHEPPMMRKGNGNLNGLTFNSELPVLPESRLIEVDSTVSCGISIQDNEPCEQQMHSRKSIWPAKAFSRAQRLSTSLKSGIRSLLHRTSPESIVFPAQQLEASRSHLYQEAALQTGCKPTSMLEASYQDFHTLPSSDFAGELPCDTSYNVNCADNLPTIRTVSDQYEPLPLGSRIASWSESGDQASQKALLLSESMRLPPFSGHAHETQVITNSRPNPEPCAYAAFRQPLLSRLSESQVHTQRVFSALKREIERKTTDNAPNKEQLAARSVAEDTSCKSGRNLAHSYTAGSDTEQVHSSRASLSDKRSSPYLDQWRTRGVFPGERGFYHEVGSRFFPASTRVERDRGASPFRRMRATLPSGSNLSDSKDQPDIENCSFKGVNYATTTKTLPIEGPPSASDYSNESEPSITPRGLPDNPLAFTESFGTARMYSPSSRALVTRPDSSNLALASRSSRCSSGEWQPKLATICASDGFPGTQVGLKDSDLIPTGNRLQCNVTEDVSEVVCLRPLTSKDGVANQSNFASEGQLSRFDSSKWMTQNSCSRPPPMEITPHANSEVRHDDPGHDSLSWQCTTETSGQRFEGTSPAKSMAHGAQIWSPTPLVSCRVGLPEGRVARDSDGLGSRSCGRISFDLASFARDGGYTRISSGKDNDASHHESTSLHDLSKPTVPFATNRSQCTGSNRSLFMGGYLKDRRRDVISLSRNDNETAFL